MGPHPDFADIELPRHADLSGFILAPLTPEQLDEDFETVTASASVLAGLFGDWPAGLTREANLIDLAWHEREFTLRRSFSWILRSPDGAYLGCAYLFPTPGARGTADVCLWIRDCPDRVSLLERARETLAPWLKDRLPAALVLTWREPTAR